MAETSTVGKLFLRKIRADCSRNTGCRIHFLEYAVAHDHMDRLVWV